jgi:hypothetical protein
VETPESSGCQRLAQSRAMSASALVVIVEEALEGGYVA